MKILFISKNYHPNILGGGEVSLKLLCESLVHAGHDITVLTFDGAVQERVSGVTVVREFEWKTGISLLQLWRAFRVVKSRSLEMDILHGYNLFLYSYLGWFGQNFHAPIVVTLNNIPSLRTWHVRDWVKRLMWKFYLGGLKKLNNFIVLAAHQKETYVEMGLPKNLIHVIPNMVDPAFLVPRSGDRSGETEVVRYIGMLHGHKGVHTLIRAIVLIPSAQLFIHGKGNDLPALKQLVVELGLENRVAFQPYVDTASIPEILDNTDVLVHPVLSEEPFGRSVLEGMVRGVPVLVSNMGEPPNLIRESKLIFQAGNENELAQKLSILLKNPTLRRELGLELKARARKHFSVDRVLKQLEDLYADIVK